MKTKIKVHLVDGTYELFRAHFGAPSALGQDGSEVGATRGLLRSLLSLVGEEGVTHVACAFDHVIESFRNKLFDGYKTSEGVDQDILAQFPLAERAAHALGLVVWPMTKFEADDALATAAHRWSQDSQVEQVFICTPDKDLAQCVLGERVVCYDRRRQKLIDEDGVVEKFGVKPASIPDWLALVGDSADGIPGVPRWGAKGASTVLAHYGSIEKIPRDAKGWAVKVRGRDTLGENLNMMRKEAKLYRKLATLRTDVPLKDSLEDLEWKGARRDELESLCAELGEFRVVERVGRWRE